MISWLNEGISILWWKVVHKQRGKPGEMGKAVAIPPDKEAEKKEMFKVNYDMTHCVSNIFIMWRIFMIFSRCLFFTKIQVNQFNLMASEMISLNRSLQDVRLSACKNKVTLAFSTTFANFFDCLFVILGLREPAADHLSSNCLPQWGVDHTSQNGCVNI